MIIPTPSSVVPADPGRLGFRLDERVGIDAPSALRPAAEWLRDAIAPATGLPLPIGPRARVVRFRVDEGLADEEYTLDVQVDGVLVAAGGPAGALYAAQTFVQLLPPEVFRQAAVPRADWTVPAVTIRDRPRFGWRGVMLDVVRHFMPKRELMRFIDLMAMHKLNVLHLHLTDDQGWRVEIRRYPRLTGVGAWRRESQVGAGATAPTDGRPHGGFYTQQDLKEIVRYAERRSVTVVPEIETPGHVRAALAAYPHLGVTGEVLDVWTRWGICEDVLNVEDSTVEFFCGVLDEVMEIFPSAVIGIGGDECPTVQWRNSPRTQELMRERGLADERDVHTWFLGRLAAHLRGAGRRAFAWDELLEGETPDDAVVASWRGSTGTSIAARRHIDVVSCPDDFVYLDYRQSDAAAEPIPVSVPTPMERVLAFDPVPADLDEALVHHVLGGQAHLWTEHMDHPRTIDYFAFPRLCAVAEVLWSGSPTDPQSFIDAMEREHLPRLDAVGVEYRPQDGPLPWQQRPGIPGRPETVEERAEHIAHLVAKMA